MQLHAGMDLRKFVIEEQKRRTRLAEEILSSHADEPKRKRLREREQLEIDEEAEYFYCLSASLTILSQEKMRKRRAADLIRDRSWFADGFNNWDDKLFKKHFRIGRDTFNFLLTSIEDNIRKKPTSMKPNPASPECQLALTIYRLAHGSSYTALEDHV